MPDLGKPIISVGAIGHTGDGKTTLLSSITHVLSTEPGCSAVPWSVHRLDRIPMGTPFGSHPRAAYADGTLQRSAIPYESSVRRYAHIDNPGRRSLIRAAARGVSIVDAAILVVSAEDGVRAQTREHLVLAHHAGARHFVVFLNKCDVADSTTADVVELEVRRMFTDYDLDGDDVRVIRGSAIAAVEGEPWRSGIVALIEALDGGPAPDRDVEGLTLFRIDELYGRVSGNRTLAAGRVERGTLEAGQSYARIGFGDLAPTQIDSIELFHQRVPRADAGEHIGVMLSGLERRTFVRGQVLTMSQAESATSSFSADILLLTQAQGGRHTPIFSGHQAHFHLGAAGMTGAISFDDPSIAPGAKSRVRVELLRPVHLEVGMGLVFRDGCDGFRRKFGGPPQWGGTAGIGRVTGL